MIANMTTTITTTITTTLIITGPAADAIKPGDYLLEMDGIPMGTEGVLVEGADLVSTLDLAQEYDGLRMFRVTIWGRSTMTELTMKNTTSVRVSREVRN